MRDFYATIPKTVRVGGLTYSIQVIAGFEQASDRYYGDHNSVLQRIRLCADMSNERLANTFMHELMHAIHCAYDVGDNTDEESNTYRTTNGLCAFWRDNPEAAAWWAALASGSGK